VLQEYVLSGDPYAFRGQPSALHNLRTHLSKALNVNENNIVVVGSAQVGFSLSPDNFPRGFTDGSDIDVVVVDERLFDIVWHTLLQWHYPRRRDLPCGDWAWTTARRKELYWGWFVPNNIRFNGLSLPAALNSYYLAMSTSTVMNNVFVKAGNALAILGGDSDLKDLNKVPDNVDGGIRPYAKPLFARWVAAMRRAEDKKAPSGSAIVDGSQNLMQFVAKMLGDPSSNPILLIDTLQDESNWRHAYEDARNWSELMSSGLNLSKFVPPDVYIRSQMEADVSWALGQNKRDDLPDPVAATKDVYDLFVTMFGKQQVFDAANATLRALKNSVGGLATRTPVEIGEFVMSPSPNPYYLFLSQVTKSSPRAYAIALAFDPNILLTMQPAAAFNMKDNWQKAFSVYNQLVAKYGEANVWAAAGRLKDIPKDSEMPGTRNHSPCVSGSKRF
jgi:hypothetical protein